MVKILSSLFALSLSAFAVGQQSTWGQCGGIGWSGATSCVSGASCSALNSYYYQCLPASTATTATTATTSTTTTSSTTTTTTSTSSSSSSSTITSPCTVDDGICSITVTPSQIRTTTWVTTTALTWCNLCGYNATVTDTRSSTITSTITVTPSP